MVRQNIIDYPQFDGIKEEDKIEFFRKIKNSKLDAISVIFKETSPDVVKQAALFVSKIDHPGFTTSINGVLRAADYVLYSHEYVKENGNWIIYLNFKVNKKQGVEFTKINPFIRFAIANINGVNYLAYEGSNKVFVISEAFAGPFGYIDLNKLNDFMASLDDKSPYKLSNIAQEAYLVDAPAQLFGKDTAYYRDGDNFGFWMSFGTLVKFDNIDFNNINIDGTPVALVDLQYSQEARFKKMLNAKAAGYACVLFDEEAMLSYLLKEAKEYILNAKKQDLNKVCLEDLIKNVSEKGILGITYQKVESLKQMYIPAFDYTTAKVKDVIGPALAFIYDDEYIWMHYDKENNEIDFMTYKGDNYTFSDDKVQVSVWPEPTLSKVNKTNPDNFVLFTGFKNLEENNVLDIYFDGNSQILRAKNARYAVDITAFDDYYENATKSFNGVYNEPNEIIKTYGTNKYAFITGLVHYKPILLQGKIKGWELSVQTMPSIASVIDAVEKKAHLNNITLSNYGYISTGGFNAPLDNFIAYTQYEVVKQTGKGKIPKNATNPELFMFVSNMNLFRNGYFTYKDASANKYVTVLGDRDVYTDFTMVDFSSKIQQIISQSVRIAIDAGQDINVQAIASNAYNQYQSFAYSVLKAQEYSIKSEITKKVKVVSTKERWEFEKVSDNMYVNNKPTSEICNHAILFEDAFQNALRGYFNNVPEKGFLSEYIQAAKFTSDEHGYYLDVKLDLSEKGKTYIYPDAGIMAVNMPKAIEDNEFLTFKPKMIVKNSSKREINGEIYNVFYIIPGYEIDINVDNFKAMDITTGPAPQIDKLAQAEDILAKAKREKEEMMQKDPRHHLAKAIRDGENAATLKVSEDNKFIPVGLECFIAYNNGKILTSIGGEDFYEPFVTDNGLRLNMNLYINDVESFGLMFKNMVLSDIYEHVVDGVYVDKDIVDLQQVKIDRISVNKEMNAGMIEFSFKDIPAVINGVLYQPGDKVIYTFDLDVDIDYIDPNTNRRIVFWDINVQYQTIYPIDTNRQVNSAEDILNNENCFLVNHHIPVTIALDAHNYIYEKKSQAVEDGFFTFINFTNQQGDNQ